MRPVEVLAQVSFLTEDSSLYLKATSSASLVFLDHMFRNPFFTSVLFLHQPHIIKIERALSRRPRLKLENLDRKI